MTDPRPTSPAPVPGTGGPPEPRALIIVDVQNDFTEGSATGVDGGDQVAYAIGAYLSQARERYAFVVTTQDWHIAPRDDHFTKHPVHCVAGSPGAALDPELSRGAGRDIGELVDAQLRKGAYGADYSGFLAMDGSGKALPQLLGEQGIRSVDICGLAEDVCVAATANDAIEAGMDARVLTDLSGATSDEGAMSVERALASRGALVIGSAQAWPTSR